MSDEGSDRSLKHKILRTSLDLYNCVFYSVTSRYPFGRNIFGEDWDIAIVLDACRVDVMNAVEEEYDFITDVDSIWSVGSSSHEWTVQTFSSRNEDRLRETAFLSANSFSQLTLVEGQTPPYKSGFSVPFLSWDPVEDSSLAYYEQVSRESTGLDVVPPWKMTDRMIDVGRNSDFSRIVAHYFQPHRPFLSVTDDPMTESELVYDRPMELYELGEISREELWRSQVDNLRAVLDCVEVLLSNVNAESVVITADHGQLLGEFGETGHPGGLLHPAVRKVPWVETTASDEETYSPRSPAPTASPDRGDVDQRLKDLGYI